MESALTVHFQIVAQGVPVMIHLPQGCRPPDPRQTAYISFHRAQKPAKCCTVLHNAIPYTLECSVRSTYTGQQCVNIKLECSPPSYHYQVDISPNTYCEGLGVGTVLHTFLIYTLGQLL